MFDVILAQGAENNLLIYTIDKLTPESFLDLLKDVHSCLISISKKRKGF